MHEKLTIQSHKGPYTVTFGAQNLQAFLSAIPEGAHYLIDNNVAQLHQQALHNILACGRCVIVDATEENKSLERIGPVAETLLRNRIRRQNVLVAIGGGIIQDITCFIASTLLRGLPWFFIPTTLLAQADSCIGSKSSINLGVFKNILGTFNPPRMIHISESFLDTLDQRELLSGIGEILKVHAIDGRDSFDRLSAAYDMLLSDRVILLEYIERALLIKKKFIEIDEFDTGIRNIFNYGHSFGHAIESVTDFSVPHGIAVTMGMAIANRVSQLRGLVPDSQVERMRPVLIRNCAGFASTRIHAPDLVAALMKDKKNTVNNLVLILPVGPDSVIQKIEVAPDQTFERQCRDALGELASEHA